MPRPPSISLAPLRPKHIDALATLQQEIAAMPRSLRNTAGGTTVETALAWAVIALPVVMQLTRLAPADDDTAPSLPRRRRRRGPGRPRSGR